MIDFKLDKSVFNETFYPYLEKDKGDEVYYGGASSGKSVFVAQKKVFQHLKDAGRKTLVARKVARTLRQSVFAEVCNVLSEWHLMNKVFRVNKSDMEITRVDNATKFVFAGLDDVEKLKSIQGITDVWVEEATEISFKDYTQLKLRARHGRFANQMILTYNPVSALSWLKGVFHDRPDPDRLIVKTTYKDNRFLKQETRDFIERLAIDDPEYYKIYGLGDWGVLGNLVYSNYIIESFDTNAFNDSDIYYGLDWGYNDPSAFVKMAYKDREIYILDGLYRSGLTNLELMREVEERFGKDMRITADSSEPARIEEWRKAGWKIEGAEKGKDSVKFGIDFCRRHLIRIHENMVEFAGEIQSYGYRENKQSTGEDDKYLEEPIDARNHYMDAMRYGFEKLAYERPRPIDMGISFDQPRRRIGIF